MEDRSEGPGLHQIAALQAQLEAEDELGIYEGPNGFVHILRRRVADEREAS